MTITVNIGGAVPAEGGNARPLPDNTRVLATIVPTRKDGNSIDKRPYGGPNSPNNGITALNVRFRIADGQEGAGRNIFQSVPLATAFASGNTAHQFFNFFRALGYDLAPNSQFALPDDREMLGKPVTLVLGVEDDPRENAEPGAKRNYAKFVNPPSAGTPRGTLQHSAAQPPRQAQPAQVWNPGPQAAREVAAQQSGADVWEPSQAPARSGDVWQPDAAALAASAV